MKFLPVLGLVVTGWLTAAHAEVTTVDEYGFSSTHRAGTSASPEQVYTTLLEIAGWWDPAHSWGGDAAQLYLDTRPGGCFCETLPDGGWVEHLRIIYLAPQRQIHFSGALGPLQTMGVNGVMVWKISATEAGSTLEWRYTVHGHIEGGFAGIAPAVDGVVGEQLARLLARIQSG